MHGVAELARVEAVGPESALQAGPSSSGGATLVRQGKLGIWRCVPPVGHELDRRLLREVLARGG